jgi:hypothetical protein
MHQTSRSLVRRKERDDNLSPVAAALAAQSIADLYHREIITEVRAQLDEAQPRMVPALAAVRAVIIALIDVSEAGGFEFGVIHLATVPGDACAYPRDNSYSIRRPPILDTIAHSAGFGDGRWSGSVGGD